MTASDVLVIILVLFLLTVVLSLRDRVNHKTKLIRNLKFDLACEESLTDSYKVAFNELLLKNIEQESELRILRQALGSYRDQLTLLDGDANDD